ncbi:MAG: cob(I)yrinic acid a,c-diamide adenosyltransferase [Clostridia bacterium]|jgi:cob(I)alamin adenosyltransferase|nr:cob(I)yrinic acid a,c-diamide adenosyltransferase [Clostridia bacterium]
MKGYFHIYCGDGKGKTTAAIGLCVRAAGSGMKVIFVQFMKGIKSSEINILENISNINVLRCDESFGFYWNMDDTLKKKAKAAYSKLIDTCINELTDKNTLVVLDEALSALKYGFIEKDKVLEIVELCEKGVEVVVTGREPQKYLIDKADYITEMKCIRHPYEKGVAARKGIEY